VDVMLVAEAIFVVDKFFSCSSFHDSAHNGFGMLVN